MRKLKNLNTVLLSIALMTLVVMGAFTFGQEMWWNIESWLDDQATQSSRGMKDTPELQERVGQLIPTQIVSYDTMNSFNRKTSWWVIPIERVGLQIDQDISEQDLEALNANLDHIIVTGEKRRPFTIREIARESRDFSSSSRMSYSSNLVLHNDETNEVLTLFDERVAVFKYLPVITHDSLGIAIIAANKDNNKDGKWTSSDVKTLHYYDLGLRQMHTAEFSGSFESLIKHREGSPNIYIETGIDLDSNGQIDSNWEPSRIQRFDTRTMKLQPVISKEELGKLQNSLNDE